MNLIGTILEQNSQNKFYAEFCEKNPDVNDKDYEWKCWMLKKYFKDSMALNITRIAIGFIMFLVSCFGVVYKIFGHHGYTTVITVLCLVLGFLFIGSGLMCFFSNYKCLKNYKDYLWDEEGEIVTKIITFYDKER